MLKSLLLTAALLGVTLPAQAVDWALVVAKDGTQTYIDRDSIYSRGEAYQIRQWDVYPTVQKYGIKSQVIDSVVNCKAFTIQPLKITNFNSSGQVINQLSAPPGEPPTALKPGTVGEQIGEFLCH
jgi:hypothetical protein